ncbi:MAG TPA: GAF domain-containing protein [Actinocrinis sp.]|jgi:anti-anti-sigma factor
MASSDSPGTFHLTVARTDDEMTLELAGELDMLAASALMRTVPQPQDCAGRIILDASRVTFCATAGMRILLMLHDRVEACDGELIVQRPSDAVLHVLKTFGELDHLRIESGPGSAHAAPAGLGTARFRQVLDSAMRVAHAPMGYARAAEPPDGELKVVARRGVGRLLPSFFETMHGAEPMCITRPEQLRPVYVDDVLTSPVYHEPRKLNALRQSGVRASASIPVVTPSGDLLGQLCLLRRTRTDWSDDQRRALELIARPS